MRTTSRKLAGPLCEGKVGSREAAVLEFSKQVMSATWDFSLDGGAIGTYLFGVQLPANAIVTDCWTEELTAVTGATAVTLKAGSTSLTAALDMTADAGIQKRTLAGSAAGIKVSSASELQIAIATAAATAGKVRFYVEYMISKQF